MASLIHAAFFVIQGLISVILFMLVVYAITSWLLAFGIINTRNPTVRQILDLLERFTYPILAPFRAFVPNLGGLDLSFLVAYLVIQAVQIYLLPTAEISLIRLLG